MNYSKLILLSIIILCSTHGLQAKDSNMRFIENKGQWDKTIKYNTILNFGNIYFESNAFAFDLHDFQDGNHRHENERKKGHYFRMEFENANHNVFFTYSGKSSHYYNFFLGNDESKWQSKVHEYESITYRNLYNGIDLNIEGSGENMKYTYYVQTNANPNDILVRYNGIEKLNLKDGALYYETAFCPIVEEKPYAYQIIRGKKVTVKCEYKIINGNELIFIFPKGYNKNYELIIDPQLVFARLTDSSSDNFGFTATYDDAGNSYAGGIVYGRQGTYPTTTGAYDNTYNGGTNSGFDNAAIDIGISCYNGNTGALLYGTYVGGSSNEIPNSIIVNHAGELVVLGTSSSNNFPVSTNAYDNTFSGGTSINLSTNGVYFPSGSDIVVFKLSNDGSNMLGSTFVGGTGNDGINEDNNTLDIYDGTDLNFNYGDPFRGEVIVDEFDNVYVTSSTNSNNFPNIGVPSTLGGQQDAVIFKLNPNLSTMLFSRYVGGSNDDAGYSMKLDNNGNLFAVGGTISSNFPTTSNTLFPSYRGGSADGYLIKLSSNNGSIIRGTFLGTNNYDQVYFVDLDEENNVYIVGHTLGNYTSTTNVGFNQPNGKQFIHKLNNDLSQTFYSMKFGTGGSLVDLSPTAFLVDVCERVYVSGWGGQVGLNRNPNNLTPYITGLPTTSDALQSSTDGSDFYFFILDKNASGQLYGSYFGSSQTEEHVDGGTSRFDERGVIHQAICAACRGSSFPSSSGFSNISGSPNCNLGILKLNMDLPITSVDIDAFPRATGCVPLTVNFESILNDVVDFSWDLGDGNSATVQNPVHTYTDTGTYTVQLIGIDPNSCNISDTAYIDIWVRNDSIIADKIDTLFVDCDSLNIYVATPLGPSTHTYNWIMGDGTVYNNDTNFIYHHYDTTGTYNIILQTIDTTKCDIEAFDTISLDFPHHIKAEIGTNAGCINIPLQMQNYSNPSTETFIWDLGNGETSNEYEPYTIYPDGGEYTVYLTVIDSGTCNYISSDTNIISIIPPPVANFRTDSNYYIYPDSVQFTNYSYNYDDFIWKFGDGETDTIEVDPYHFYQTLWEFTPCLEVENEGCRDTICKEIYIDFIPLIGVPNAFSPNGDGHNDRIYVEGLGITKLSFKIYNRWGELVYEGTDQYEGWDGKYKGVMQEMEVYTYVVNALLLDGSNPILKGNITLLK